MELGLAAEADSLFEEVTEKPQKPQCQESYRIKNCYPLVIRTVLYDGFHQSQLSVTLNVMINLRKAQILDCVWSLTLWAAVKIHNEIIDLEKIS